MIKVGKAAQEQVKAYVLEKTLLEKASPVNGDDSGMGFNLSSSLELSSGCGSCCE